MLKFLVVVAFSVPVLVACNGEVIERLRGDEATATPEAGRTGAPDVFQTPQALAKSGVSINGRTLTSERIAALEANNGLYVDDGNYWYDPVSGAWGWWGGPTSGFLMPYLDLGYAPIDASGGGTGVVLNGRELHPQDLAGLQQLLGPIMPGYYWLDANGYYGYEGGQALGNLIYVAQGAGSAGGGGYYDSTYFGNIGSDGRTSYFYDSETGCSVMSGGGVSC
jgi:hypothetical protein